MSNYNKFLKDVYFFKGLSSQEIEMISDVCHEENYKAKTVIFTEGSKANRFFIVISGEVEVWKDYNKKEPDLLAVHGAGNLFGEMALIDELPRSATVIARTLTHVLYIQREDFQRIVTEKSSIALSIMKSVSSMVRQSNESFVENLRKRNKELEKANKELKETQEELLRIEKLSAIGKFSSLILHDIRNPLSILRGYAELIAMHLDDPRRIKNNIHKIIAEADRINRLANELLDYSRGEIRLTISIVNLKNFIDKVIEVIKDRFSARNIEIKKDISFSGPVLLDKSRLFRVFLNIADNARKAMPNGGEFVIKVYNKNNFIYFDLIDTGMGMSKDVLKKIFEPFFSSSQAGGTGLGMCIVKSIIEAHDGTLSVVSKEGVGTKFHIALPMLY